MTLKRQFWILSLGLKKAYVFPVSSFYFCQHHEEKKHQLFNLSQSPWVLNYLCGYKNSQTLSSILTFIPWHYIQHTHIQMPSPLINEGQYSASPPSQITALSWQRGLHNSMKLWAMTCRTTQDEQVTVEGSDKTWSTKEGKSKPLQYSCLENPMNSMKRQRYDTGRWRPPGCKVSNMLPEKSRGQLLIAPERMKQLDQRGNDAQLCTCLVVMVKSDAIKNNAACKPGMLGPWIKVNWTCSSRRWQEWTWAS